jgi:hypothetical protein
MKYNIFLLLGLFATNYFFINSQEIQEKRVLHVYDSITQKTLLIHFLYNNTFGDFKEKVAQNFNLNKTAPFYLRYNYSSHQIFTEEFFKNFLENPQIVCLYLERNNQR